MPSAQQAPQQAADDGNPLRKRQRKEVDPNFTARWGGLNHASFYDKVSQLLRAARNGAHPDHDTSILELDQLLLWYRDKRYPGHKAVIDGYVRVRSKKRSGMVAGSGLDELFKTSETASFIEWSYKPEGSRLPYSLYRDKGGSLHEFDWVDAQRAIRVSTELIIWSSDKVGQIISGHTGSLQENYKQKWMTAEQATMHTLRQAAIERRNSPATAVIQALHTHLEVTVNLADFQQALYKNGKSALLVNGANLADAHAEVAIALERNRDKLKLYLESFKQRVVNPPRTGPQSPLHATTSAGSPVLHSPVSSRGTSPIRSALLPGESLPTLQMQALVDWKALNKNLDKSGVKHGPIPPNPNKKKRKRDDEEEDDDG